MKETPVWMKIATGYLGVKEIPGPKHSSVIQKWLTKLGAWWADDETPWCGTFVAECLKEAKLSLPKHWYRAKAWAEWGKPCKPDYGAVLVFTRMGGGHVGFYAGENDLAYYVLGGNQGNMVKYSWILKSRLAACRWPTELPAPAGNKIRLLADGEPVSVNEQ